MEGDHSKSFGVAITPSGEYVFITERPYLNEAGLFQAAAIDAQDVRYIVYWQADDEFAAGYDEDAYQVVLL